MESHRVNSIISGRGPPLHCTLQYAPPLKSLLFCARLAAYLLPQPEHLFLFVKLFRPGMSRRPCGVLVLISTTSAPYRITFLFSGRVSVFDSRTSILKSLHSFVSPHACVRNRSRPYPEILGDSLDQTQT